MGGYMSVCMALRPEANLGWFSSGAILLVAIFNYTKAYGYVHVSAGSCEDEKMPLDLLELKLKSSCELLDVGAGT